MKRPLLPVALLYIGGIFCGQYAHPALPVLFGASFLAAALALASARGRIWLTGLLVVLTGWTGACRRAAILAPDDLRLQLGQRTEETRLRGIIQAPPAQRIFERGGRELSHSSALIEVSGIFIGDTWQPAFGKVIATVPGVLSSNFFEGQSVEVAGVIHPPGVPLAQGLFDARTYYARQGVFYELQAASTNDFHLPGARDLKRLPISEWFRRWATKTLALGLPGEDEPFRLTRTLLLDWKPPLWTEIEEPFMRAGTYHIFAVDGLRIGLLAGICLGLLRLLQIPRPICGAVLFPILWFYVGLTGWPASAVRAAVMVSVVIACWALRRPADLINSLCAEALILLVWQPDQLFQAGFQLSFLVVACIALIVPSVNERLQRKLFSGDPLLPDTLQPRWPWVLYKPASYLVEMFSLSLAAWVGSIPLAAYYFHLFTPVSVPANCVVVPATALALIGGMGSLLTGAWWPGLAALFNNATWALMKFILWFSRWAATWPDGNFNAAAPSAAVCACYYAALFMIITGWIFRSRQRWVVSGAMLAAGVCLAVQWAVAKQTAHIDILPLKGAPVIFVDSPGRQGNLLVGCADTESAAEILKPFLCAQGVNRLSALCLAVGLLPHFGGTRVILDNFIVDRIFIASAPNRSEAYRNLIGELRPTALHDGDRVGAWSVLHPGVADEFAQADDNALVLRRECNGRSILLLPALARDGQNALMRRHPDLRADIVVAGLPARDEPLCDPLLDMLQARLIIIADSEFPATRRASPKLRQRLARRPAQVVYCHNNGALTLDLAPQKYSLRTANGALPGDSGE
ncbi:MAG TPA: ComEC/Rec2 family competence protein [Candidatus Saccharimonadales bacterium]|nr:ComEC/Rec2 family competence protein [Candidatus Saccharimonadales bacterium]